MASAPLSSRIVPVARRTRCAACGGEVAVYRAGTTRPACLSCLACGQVRFAWLSKRPGN